MSPQAKGTVAIATLDYLRTVHGGALVQRVLDGMTRAARMAVTAAAPTSEIPLVHVYELWRAADTQLRATVPDWMEQAGAHSITSKGVQFYSGIVHKSTPLAFLTQPVSLFRLFYQPGGMEIVEYAEDRAVLRLCGFDADVDVLFCRRQTGGLRRALELAGGSDAAAQHVRCITEGDAFCEWELIWNVGS
jgi:hypothetical protein